MNRIKHFYRLEFDQQAIFNQKVGTERFRENHLLIFDLNRLLPFNLQSTVGQ